MKKTYIFLLLILSLIICRAAIAEPPVTQVIYKPSTGTWDHELSLDDDAANTTVVNSGGTGKGNWETTTNTSNYHDATAKEGTGSFRFTSEREAESAEAWTAEKFEVIFWYYPDAATASSWAVLWQISADGDRNRDENNEFMFVRDSGTDEAEIWIKDGDGTLCLATTTDLNFAQSTWVCIKCVVDMATTFDAQVYKSTDCSTWGSDLLGAWDTAPDSFTFNSSVWLGTVSPDRPSEGLIDYFRMRSTE